MHVRSEMWIFICIIWCKSAMFQWKAASEWIWIYINRNVCWKLSRACDWSGPKMQLKLRNSTFSHIYEHHDFQPFFDVKMNFRNCTFHPFFKHFQFALLHSGAEYFKGIEKLVIQFAVVLFNKGKHIEISKKSVTNKFSPTSEGKAEQFRLFICQHLFKILQAGPFGIWLSRKKSLWTDKGWKHLLQMQTISLKI